jgi:hypothetical protein
MAEIIENSGRKAADLLIEEPIVIAHTASKPVDKPSPVVGWHYSEEPVHITPVSGALILD